MTEKSGNSKGSELNFKNLTPWQPRQFLPAGAGPAQKEEILSFYRQLLDRPVKSGEDLRSLIADRSELEAATDQIKSILYIQMTCQTDDPARAKAYKSFIENVVPAIKPLADRLDRKMIESADGLGFNEPYYEVYFRKMRADIELFNESNIPLQTEDDLLSQDYQTVTGAMTVPYEGRDYPIPQMQKFLLEPDRNIREGAWRSTADRYLQDKDRLDDIFDRMVSVRHRIARNAGFENYRDYKFREYHRFDYTPGDCKQFHEAVETYFVPVLRHIHRSRRERMRVDPLRPWDLAADPLGSPPLKPAATPDEFLRGLQTMFGRVEEDFGRQFRMMSENGLLDLESRKGKAPGGYQSTLNEARMPFIFGNTIGTNNDLHLMTHEGGHAFHALACAHEPLLSYRHAPTEFCEVASMSMELLAAAHLDVFYDKDQQQRWWQDQLQSVVYLLLKVAAYDAFQHWLYENPRHTTSQREQKWIDLDNRFGSGLIDWTGLETEQASYWHRVLHFFQVPFYFIEYGIAQLGALGMWLQSKQDTAEAIANYRKALALGGRRPLPELFTAAGLVFDFSEQTIRPLAENVMKEWQHYSNV